MIKKVKIITLGCDKNTVDSEILAGQLKRNNIESIEDFNQAEAIIVNTCGFIKDAKEESIDTIFEALGAKKKGIVKKVFVMGCLSERYKNDLIKEMPEVDNIWGLKEFDSMVKEIKNTKDDFLTCNNERISLGLKHIAYIRISDGCNHACSYCAIPSIRGRYKSRNLEDILAEIKTFLKNGVKEFILIGQEISSWGLDLFGGGKINYLLEQVSKLIGDNGWIRLLYTYPSLVDEEFIETISKHDNICNYIDFPIQHSESEVLKIMNRSDTRISLKKQIEMMRKIIPNIAIRTSIITGLPNESRKSFLNLEAFVEEIEFDRLGCFAFSPEEGTKAGNMKHPLLKTAKNRTGELMEIQQDISYENNTKLIGNVERVLIDRIEGNYSIGRTYRDAPDIDNEVLVKEQLQVGEFYNIKIVDAVEFDLYGILEK